MTTIYISVCLILMLLLNGCANTPALQAQNPVVRAELNENQMLLMLAGRKAEIRDVYGDELFAVKMSDGGTTYNDVFYDMAKDYIEKTCVMTEMCTARAISLSLTESKDIRNRAEKYTEDLQAAGITCAITPEDAEKVLSDRLYIDKLREEIIQETGVEVSESEAKVMDITRIELEKSEDAYATLEEINTGETAFDTIARRNSTNAETVLKVGRGDLGKVIDEVIFEMEEGEISPVIQSQNKYYIIKIDKGYDSEATAQRKEEMIRKQENELLGNAYRKYVAENPYTIEEEKWSTVLTMSEQYPKLPDIYAY